MRECRCLEAMVWMLMGYWFSFRCFLHECLEKGKRS
jgi:hypothetical protein